MKVSLAAMIGGAVGSAAAACTPSNPTPPPASGPPPEPVQDASAQSPDALEQLFLDGSPEDIAAKLETMLSAPEAGPDANGVKKPQPPAPPTSMAPTYKGVSF